VSQPCLISPHRTVPTLTSALPCLTSAFNFVFAYYLLPY
jgi:hypothetical protein